MSLINDALRRASQSEKNRPPRTPTSIGMEAVREERNVVLSVLLTVAVLIALVLAAWFFWQWWTLHNTPVVVPAANVFPSATPQVNPSPVAPNPAPAVQAAPAAPANPAPAPVAAIPAAPSPTDGSQVAWPVDLKLTAIFYSKVFPHALINGSLCETGDKIQGVVVKEIENDKVTVEWNGHSKELMMEGN